MVNTIDGLVAVVAKGTLIGKKILERVDERTFVRLFKLALLLAGVKVLCYDGVYGLWRQ